METKVPFGMLLPSLSFAVEEAWACDWADAGGRVDCARLKFERRELVNSVFDFSKVGRRGRIEGAVFIILLETVSLAMNDFQEDKGRTRSKGRDASFLERSV